ncbi:MAG: protein TolR [Desulfobacteraceae bacterium]|nr:protein TolR [Desulfobacteraceae bacterium]
MAFGGNQDRLMSEINVTPFVDVMLVLLIIFMVTAPMMIQGVDVSLPETAAEPLKTEEEPLTITVDKDGLVYINDLKVQVDFLQEKLRKILQGRKDPEVFFRGDQGVAYGIIVQVMSEIKEAGVVKLGMVTDPPPPEIEPK